MNTKKLRLGIIGSGFVSHFHAMSIRQIRGIEIVGIHSTNPESARGLASYCRENELGATEAFSSVEDLVRHVDAVALYAPNFARVELLEKIVDSVKKGNAESLKGVICEKPLGRNMQEARRVCELVESVNLRTAYFENQIFMNCIQSQLDQLRPQQETMGPMSLTRSAEEHGGPHNSWFWNPTLQGGGVLSDMGCHSIAVGWYTLTPPGKPLDFLVPQSVSCDVGLLKWGQKHWREKLLKDHNVDYTKTPAEDFATGVVTYKNPETGQIVKSQFTDSWMFEKQGLRLFMDGTGPGYAFEINTLVSPLQVFVGDAAAEAVADQETALEKSTASRGLLSVQPNEPDLYGYTDENRDALRAFNADEDAKLSFRYGLEITRLVMASYLSAERGQTIDLTNPEINKELETYIPAIQQGRGAEQLF